MPVDPNLLILADRKEQGGIIQKNASASLIDLGDGVLGLEFHSKMNALDEDIFAIGQATLEAMDKGYVGLVIGNEAPNFCVGANVFNVLVAADAKKWDEIEKGIKSM